MSDLSEAMVTAGANALTLRTLAMPDEREEVECDTRAVLAAALRVLADRGYTLEEDGASIWSVVYPRQLADDIEHPAQCTCEYPYPREIWDGHHPNCAVEQQKGGTT